MSERCKRHGVAATLGCGACFAEQTRAKEAGVVERLALKHAVRLAVPTDDEALREALREAYRFGAIA